MKPWWTWPGLTEQVNLLQMSKLLRHLHPFHFHDFIYYLLRGIPPTSSVNSTPCCNTAVIYRWKHFFSWINYKNVMFKIIQLDLRSNNLFLHDNVLDVLSQFSAFSHSGQSHAHVQCSCGHWHHGLRHSRPRTDISKATTERSLVRHPQLASTCKDGRRVQGLREYVWSHAWHLSRNIRCVYVCVPDTASLVNLKIWIVELEKKWITSKQKKNMTKKRFDEI